MNLELYLLVGIVFIGIVLVLLIIAFITAWFYVAQDSHGTEPERKND